MVTEFQLTTTTGTPHGTTIRDTEATSIIIFMIQIKESITRIISGIGIMDGDIKSHQPRLLQLMIQIHISRDHIMIMMMCVEILDIGQE
jgi:hypothetical protein